MNAQHNPRHRKVRRPVVPAQASLADNTVARGAAVASVTGLALTAVIVPSVSAAPASEATALTTTVSVDASVNTVSVADIAWTANDEVTVSAEAPAAEAPEDAPVEEAAEPEVEQQDEAANRNEAREEAPAQPAPAPAVNYAGGDIVSIASSLTGIPYVYGGTSPAGFDCSGFTQYVYAQAGISIPRTSHDQGMAGTFISAAEARPGDLVWHAYGHVGIYAGNGMVIEATTPGSTTKIQPLWGDYSFVRY